MLKLKFYNHHTNEEYEIPLDESGVQYLDDHYQFKGFMSEHPNTMEGLQEFVKYLSNHHMDVSIDTMDLKKQRPNELAISEKSQNDLSKSDELISLLTKGSARLEKMSRPRISFPKMGLDTRPDQNVQLLEEPRQVKLFGRKVADQQIKDFENKKGIKLNPANKEKEMKRLSGKVERTFGNNTLGLNYSMDTRDISASLAGKARSKHEAPDEEHTQKVKENTEKHNEAKLKYYDDLISWKKESEQFPSGSTAWWNHMANRPKMPAKPRKPVKRKVETKNLTPEQMKSRGQAVESTIEHEALHHLLGQVERKFGDSAYKQVRDKLLSNYKPETLNALANWISEARGYKKESDSFKEEILTHARDVLVNPEKRNHFKNYLNKKIGINAENYYNEHIKNLKQGHQKSYEWAQNLTPEELQSVSSGDNQIKIAAEKKKNQ